MKIQINTDRNISEDKRMDDYFKKSIEDSLKHFSEHITRIEVHFSDENANKQEPNDKRCLIEARLKGKQPTAVVGKGNTLESAFSSAIEKITALLKTATGHLKDHH